MAGCWSRPSSSSAAGRSRTNMRAAFRVGTRDAFAASKSRTAGGISPPVRLLYHSASWAVEIPRSMPRRNDAGVTRNRLRSGTAR